MNNPWQNIDQPGIDFNVRLVSESHPLLLYWGRDTQGHYLFIYDLQSQVAPDKQSLPKLAGISFGLARDHSGAKLVLILNETTNWEIFFSLCSDLIRATSVMDNPESASGVFLRRLIRWSEFLRRKRPEILSPEAIKGLIGELLFLEERLAPAFSWDDAVASWKGPEDAPQDFSIHEMAMEVKCQTGGTTPSVKITSADQLTPQLPDAYLIVYTITTADREDAEGFSLNDLVEQIRSRLETGSENTRERFEELLFLADYTMREEYDDSKFRRVAAKCYKIGDDFPRILLSAIPAGIERVSYSLKLEQCKPFESSPSWWGELS
jgi:hypothetical protein